eukprot:16355-Heterococcus_DN1.PRE.2
MALRLAYSVKQRSLSIIYEALKTCYVSMYNSSEALRPYTSDNTQLRCCRDAAGLHQQYSSAHTAAAAAVVVPVPAVTVAVPRVV